MRLDGSGLDASTVWNKSVSLLQSHLDPQIFAAWIKPLIISRVDTHEGLSTGLPAGESNIESSTEVELVAPNRFCCEHVERMYGELISSTVTAVAGLKNVQLKFRVDTANAGATSGKLSNKASGSVSESISSSTATSASRSNTVEQLLKDVALADGLDSERVDSKSSRASTPSATSNSAVSSSAKHARPSRQGHTAGTAGGRAGRGVGDSNLNPKYNFSNFIIGSCNQFAQAVGIRISQDLGSAYNPLFVYGGVGLGKTHLVNAIGNAAIRAGKNALLVSSEVFVNEVIAAIRGNKMQQFKSKFRSLDLLIIDDIQFLIGKERTQEEFFHTFNDLHHRHRQIVITSDKTPQELVGLEERLRTRFSSGLSVDLQAPDFETRVAILCKKAEASGHTLSENVARLLAEKIDTNVRELEGALNRLLALSSLRNVPITPEFADEALRTLIPERAIREITFELIQKTVAERYGVSISDLLGKRRTQNIAFARHVAMFLCRRLTGRSFPEIGALFGGRDHSTVIHATRVIETRSRTDARFSSDLSGLERALRG